MAATRIASARRLVVKIGSALLTNNGEGLDLAAIGDWARQIAELTQGGKQLILVSSGAIACGLQRFIQICAEYGISLQPEACKPVPPLNLEAPRSVAEAIHMQEENEEKGQGIVEAPIAPEIVETKQKLVRAKKAKATKKPTQ